MPIRETPRLAVPASARRSATITALHAAAIAAPVATMPANASPHPRMALREGGLHKAAASAALPAKDESEPEKSFQAHRHTGVVADLPHADQHTWPEAGAIHRVVPDPQGFTEFP